MASIFSAKLKEWEMLRRRITVGKDEFADRDSERVSRLLSATEAGR